MKKINFAKVICIVIAVTMIRYVFKGCSIEYETNFVDEDNVTTFSFYNADEVGDDPWTDPIAQKITEKTGVRLKTEYPVDGNEQQISLMIASDDYPDIIFAKENAEALIEAGALIDMTDLIEKYGPNIKKLYGKYYERLRYSKEDTSIYQLCSRGVDNTEYKTTGNAMLQFDVLKDNNYKIPKTLANYEKMLKDYMKKNPTIDGKKTIGLTLCCSDWHWYITLSNPAGFIATGSPDNGQWIVDDDNNFNCIYKHTDPKQKEYFRWLNRMYNEGVLDPEFATQTYDDYIAKIASGRVLGLFDQDYNLFGAMALLNKAGKYERTYAPLPVTMDKDTKCTTLLDQGLSIGWGIGITKACADPIKAIKLIDYMCSDEGQVLINWGIEGQDYFVDNNGKRYRTDEEIKNNKENKNYSQETGISQHTYPFPCYGDGVKDATGNTYTTVTKESTMNEYNIAEKECAKAWNVDLLIDIFPQPDEFETVPYAPVWSQSFPEKFNDVVKTLDAIAWPGLIDCVVCSESEYDAKWEKLQNDLKAAGVEEANKTITALVQKNVEFTTGK